MSEILLHWGKSDDEIACNIDVWVALADNGAVMVGDKDDTD